MTILRMIAFLMVTPIGIQCSLQIFSKICTRWNFKISIYHNFILSFCLFLHNFRVRGEWYKLPHRNPQVTLSVKVKTLTTFPRYAAGVSLQQVISHSAMHNTLSTSISQLHCNVNLKGHLKSLHSSGTHCGNTTTSNGTWQLSKLNIHTQGQGC